MTYPIIFSTLYFICIHRENESTDYNLENVKLILELEGFDPVIADHQLEAFRVASKDSLLHTCIRAANTMENETKVRCLCWTLIALEVDGINRSDVSQLFFTICTKKLNLSVFDLLHLNGQLSQRFFKFKTNKLAEYL